jgi:hypothetical protein
MPLSLEHVFPEEVLDRIIGLVGDRSSLYNLCLVSSTISRIATSYLYKNVSLSGSVTGSLFPFTLLMILSPRHAAFVKTLSLPVYWKEEEPSSMLREPITSVEMRMPLIVWRVVMHLANFTTSLYEHFDWFKAICKDHDDDAITALLLASLPRLRTLVIGIDMNAKFGQWTNLILKRIGGQHRPILYAPEQPISSVCNLFAELETVVVVSTILDNPARPYLFAAFLRLPALKYLYSNGTGYGNGFNVGEEQVKLHYSSVVRIHIKEGKFLEADFKALFSALKPGVFKEFIYELDHDYDVLPVSHASIIQAMEDHRETIETLCLTYDAIFGSTTNEHQTAVSFAEFSSLKRLFIASVFIWGHPEASSLIMNKDEQEIRKKRDSVRRMLLDALPPSLEELEIGTVDDQMAADYVTENDGQSFIETYLLPALAHLSAQLPRLKRVAVVADLQFWKDSSLEAFVAFAVDAYGKGLIVELHDYLWVEEMSFSEKPWGWNETVNLPPCPEQLNAGNDHRTRVFYCNPSETQPELLMDTSSLGEQLIHRVQVCHNQRRA